MTFENTLEAARTGNADAMSDLIDQYFPLIAKNSVIAGVHDEDLEQELLATLIKCVKSFDPKNCY